MIKKSPKYGTSKKENRKKRRGKGILGLTGESPGK
jgi:hypothetical protein